MTFTAATIKISIAKNNYSGIEVRYHTIDRR